MASNWIKMFFLVSFATTTTTRREEKKEGEKEQKWDGRRRGKKNVEWDEWACCLKKNENNFSTEKIAGRISEKKVIQSFYF